MRKEFELIDNPTTYEILLRLLDGPVKKHELNDVLKIKPGILEEALKTLVDSGLVTCQEFITYYAKSFNKILDMASGFRDYLSSIAASQSFLKTRNITKDYFIACEEVAEMIEQDFFTRQH